jgi:hypothetical protein
MQQRVHNPSQTAGRSTPRRILGWLLLTIAFAISAYLVARAAQIYSGNVPSWDVQAVWFFVEIIAGLAFVAGAIEGCVRCLKRRP